MNNRIKELALQASEYVNSVYTPPVRSKTPGKIWEDGHVGWHTQFNEKFAELIVKECAGIACQHMELNEGTDYNVGGKIKQHFGVDNERTNSRTL